MEKETRLLIISSRAILFRHYRVLSDSNKTKYIYFFLKAHQELLYSVRPQQAGQPHFYRDDLIQFPIPDIPNDIQEKIVEECEKIDKEYEQTRMTIESYRSRIIQLFDTLNVISGG